MEGTLYQKGWMSYDKRHFCVEEDEHGELCLVGRVKTREGKVDKKIPLAALEAVDVVDERSYEFLVTAGETTLSLRVESKSQYANWVNGLRAILGMPDIEFEGAAQGAIDEASAFAGGLSDANRASTAANGAPARSASMSPPPGYAAAPPRAAARAQPQQPPPPAFAAAAPPPAYSSGRSVGSAPPPSDEDDPDLQAALRASMNDVPAVPPPRSGASRAAAPPPGYQPNASAGAVASRYGFGGGGASACRYPAIGGGGGGSSAAAAVAAAVAAAQQQEELQASGAPPPAYHAGMGYAAAATGAPDQRPRQQAGGGGGPCGWQPPGGGASCASSADGAGAARAAQQQQQQATGGRPVPRAQGGDVEWRAEARADGAEDELGEEEWLEETWLSEVEPEVLDAAEELGIRTDVRAERRHLWIAQLYALEPLPSGWSKQADGKGRAYFYHSETRQSRWRPPAYEAHRALLEAQHAAAAHEAQQAALYGGGAEAQRARRLERAVTLAAMEREEVAALQDETEEEGEALDESMQLAFHQLLTAGFFRVDNDGTNTMYAA